jgi:hypothetical protein
VPSPLHSTHMPCGLLNEKLCGVSSGNDVPQVPHAIFSENTRSPPSSVHAIRSRRRRAARSRPTRSGARTRRASRPGGRSRPRRCASCACRAPRPPR